MVLHVCIIDLLNDIKVFDLCWYIGNRSILLFCNSCNVFRGNMREGQWLGRGSH